MNLVVAAPFWLLGLFAFALIAAAVEDGFRLRISNVTSLTVLALAVVTAIMTGPSWALWQNVAVFIGLLVLGTAVFSVGWLGGGDVKLLAAIGLWFGLKDVLSLITLIFIAGGVVAIAFLMIRLFRGEQFKSSRKARIPYGIAISVGTLSIMALDARALTHQERSLPPINIARTN